MDDQTSLPASQRIVDALDASVRDIAEGNLHDAQAVQVEARRMLAEHERSQRAAHGLPAAGRARRARSA